MPVANAVGFTYVALVGLLVGSFLNVCILRIPAGESVITAPSHCPQCNRKLRFYELIPLFSWLLQKGRCRGCGGKISAQYPIIEAANALLWVLCAVVVGFADFSVLHLLRLTLQCAVLSALFGLAVIDARTGEIPFGFNIFIGVLGAINLAAILLQNGLAAPLEPLLLHGIGFLAVALPLYAIYLITGRRAIGGGDIKLLAAAGFFLGWRLILLGFFLACVVGSLIHVLRMRFANAGRELKLGPYLAAGIGFAMLFGDTLINLYMTSIRGF